MLLAALEGSDTTSLVLQWAIAVLFSAIVLTWLVRFVRSERRRRQRPGDVSGAPPERRDARGWFDE
jgi:hypothetical protein